MCLAILSEWLAVPDSFTPLVDTGSGGLCGLSESVFEVDWADDTEGRMASASVVDSFDPVADGGAWRLPSRP